MDTAQLADFRRQKDEFFTTSEHSPLPPGARQRFRGLRYYDPDPELVFHVPIHEGDHHQLRIQTSDGAERVYERAGTVELPIAGQTVTMALYSTGHPGYFVPFRDATSGNETYGAGRYLDVEPGADGTVTIDFNYAYNPFCAYNEAYSCPLPPPENWLPVPIRAGEKDWTPDG